MNACCSIVKFFVVLLNLAFWLAGIILVGLAVWMLVDPAFMISLAQEQQNYQYALFILLGLGILMVFLAFCGCCGACRESQCMLVSFFCCMLIVLTAEIAAGVWAYQNGSKLEAFVKLNYKNTVENEYGVIDSRTEMIDFLQKEFHCCGVDGPKDYANSKYNKGSGTSSGSTLIDLAISTQKLTFLVPQSCCRNGTDKQTCDQNRKVALTSILNNVIYKEGCMGKAVTAVKEKLDYVLIAGLILISVQLFGILLVLCLCCAVKRNKDDDYKD